MDQRLVDSLPTLTKDDVDINDNCSICFVDFKTILEDSPSDSCGSEGGTSGLTKLSGCSHVFCRKDLIQWIRSGRESCPICRNIPFSKLDDDDESDEEDEEEEEEDDDDDLYEDGDEEEEEYREMFDRLQVGVYEGP